MNTRLDYLKKQLGFELTRLESTLVHVTEPYLTDAEIEELTVLMAKQEAMDNGSTRTFSQNLNTDEASTKYDSYNKLKIGSIDYTVWEYIKDHPGFTRTEICNNTKIKIQTLSGAVTRLLASGDIYVAGSKLDTATNRNVQTLEAR